MLLPQLVIMLLLDLQHPIGILYLGLNYHYRNLTPALHIIKSFLPNLNLLLDRSYLVVDPVHRQRYDLQCLYLGRHRGKILVPPLLEDIYPV